MINPYAIGKPVPASRNSKSLVYYSGWLMLTGFISITYTNVLQSIRVVPALRYNGLTFEEMIHRNFSFDSANLKSPTDTAHDLGVSSLDQKPGSILFKEKLLKDHLVGKGDRVRNYVHSWLTFIERYSEATRLTLLVGENWVREYQIISGVFGCDLIVGKDQFFKEPNWWSLKLVERGSLLLASLQRLQQMGFVSYFLQLSDSNRWKDVQAGLEDDLLMSCDSSDAIQCKHNTAKRGGSEDAAVTFHDSLITECFTLVLYGQTAAVLVFVFEAFLEFTM